MTPKQESLSKQKIEELRNQLNARDRLHEDKSPLVRLGEAIDNGKFSGIKSNYKCNKCNREAEWETFIGIPRSSLPCGCGGNLVMQPKRIKIEMEKA